MSTSTGSDDPAREVTREELYDLVWSTPTSRLTQFGISGVALAKVCKRL